MTAVRGRVVAFIAGRAWGRGALRRGG